MLKRTRLTWLSLGVAAVLAVSGPARADDYDAKNAGHPLRIVAYVVHSAGVILDRLIFRPAHWIGHHEPIQTIVGLVVPPTDDLEEEPPEQP